MPSMVDVGDDNISVMSESSDLQRARKMYADLQAMSMESNTSQEVNDYLQSCAFLNLFYS